MPVAAPRFALRKTGAPQHKAPDNEYRAKTKPWYGTAQWKRRRAEQLAREPLCWMCQREGRASAATVADHDPPHRGNWTAFTTGPLKSLCKRHHDSDKARIENERRTKPVR